MSEFWWEEPGCGLGAELACYKNSTQIRALNLPEEIFQKPFSDIIYAYNASEILRLNANSPSNEKLDTQSRVYINKR
jgi:hypothetical protein